MANRGMTMLALATMGCLAATGARHAAAQQVVPLTVRCFNEAADRQGLDRRVLWGLFATEGGAVGSAARNTDGSHDLGPLQVNDRTWVPTVARMDFGGDTQRAREALQYNGCYNAQISAWIFKQYLVADKGDLPLAVKHYNSHNPDAMKRYGDVFARRFLALWGIRVRQAPPG